MDRLGEHRSGACWRTLGCLAVSLAILLCVPLSSLAVAWEHHSCPGDEELTSLCSKALKSSDQSHGLPPALQSQRAAALAVESLLPAPGGNPGPFRPAPAWRVRAPPPLA